MQPLPPPVQLGEITEEELKAYDDSSPKKPLLMAIKAPIYDVSQSRSEIGQNSERKDSTKGKEIGARKGITRPPLNFLAILKDAGVTIDSFDPDKLCDLLYAGVYFKPNNTRKYYVDKELNKNCFMIFAREFYICWAEDPFYWEWTMERQIDGQDIEVAELLQVWWLQIKGKIQTIDLSPGIMYEIVFVLWMTDDEYYGDHISNSEVKLSIIPQHSKTMIRYESLKDKPLGCWFEIQVGEFMMSPANVGNMNFCLEELGATLKSGLIVKGAVVRPKKAEPRLSMDTQIVRN